MSVIPASLTSLKLLNNLPLLIINIPVLDTLGPPQPITHPNPIAPKTMIRLPQLLQQHILPSPRLRPDRVRIQGQIAVILLQPLQGRGALLLWNAVVQQVGAVEDVAGLGSFDFLRLGVWHSVRIKVCMRVAVCMRV